MSFVKPLKLFLSYSHRDDLDRSLFQEFRNHLTGLEDDGLIEVWWDREITSGTAWDDEVIRRMMESRIFLPLTSASFNASRYIREEELPRAWQRYDAGQCWMMPVMWRKWDPPERSRWKTMQFLYGPEKAVCSAKEIERDDVLCVIAENLRRAIVKGQMPGPRLVGATTAAPLPAALPFLCDWMELIGKLAELRGGPARKPAVLVMVGTLADCAEEFLGRTHPNELRRKLELPENTPTPDIEIVDWPSSAGAFLRYLRPNLATMQGGLLVWKTTTSGWDADKHATLQLLLEDFRQPHWALPPDRALVTVISIITKGPDPGLVERIRGMLDQAAGVPAVAIHMPEIKIDDALGWASHGEIRRRCRPGSHMSLTQDIMTLYEKHGGASMQIGRLAPELMNFLEQYRERGAA